MEGEWFRNESHVKSSGSDPRPFDVSTGVVLGVVSGIGIGVVVIRYRYSRGIRCGIRYRYSCGIRCGMRFR